jgi:heme-degrading monooxygenase HmoA
MNARKVVIPLKANSVADFTRILEKKVMPLLRKQKGFQDEITFLVPGAREAVGISFWDTQEHAEAYSRGSYPEVLKALANVLDGTPKVEKWEVLNSTAHKIKVAVAA